MSHTDPRQEIRLLFQVMRDLTVCTQLLDDASLERDERKSGSEFLTYCLKQIYGYNSHFNPVFALRELQDEIVLFKTWLLAYQPTALLPRSKIILPFSLYYSDTERVTIIGGSS